MSDRRTFRSSHRSCSLQRSFIAIAERDVPIHRRVAGGATTAAFQMPKWFPVGRRFGVCYSLAGNGVSHRVHQDRFGRPKKTLLGSDSHTPAAGALGIFVLSSSRAKSFTTKDSAFVQVAVFTRKAMTVKREDWLNGVDDVIRSRHDTWISQGLGGVPVDEAMSWLVADIMHICRRAGVDWEDVLKQGRSRFQQEEIELIAAGSVPPES
jgi:hypothetical protein